MIRWTGGDVEPGRSPSRRRRRTAPASREGPHARAAATPAPTVALMIESDGPGGAETVVHHLAVGLSERGHDVVPFVPADGVGWLGDRLRRDGLQPETFRVHRTPDLALVARVASTLRRRRVDVVHAHEFALGVYGAAAARQAGVASVLTMHGGRYHASRLRRRLALRWAVRHSVACAAVSGATARALERDLWLPSDSVEVVPNGIDFRRGDGARVRAELGLSWTEPLVVAVGNLYAVKGHRVLLDALARLRDRRPVLAWRAAIAGRGDQEAALRRVIAQQGLSDRVTLLGLRDDVPDLLDAADVFALPSLSEGLPLALLEAMLAGRAVVASDVGGVPEVVEDRRTALLVPPGDAETLSEALELLIGDRAARMRLGVAARAAATERYSREAMLERYRTLYARGLERGGPGHGPDERWTSVLATAWGRSW